MVYHAACILRAVCQDQHQKCYPSASCSAAEGESSVPSLLFNFFAWLLDDQCHDMVSVGKVNIDDGKARRHVCSVAQDVLFHVTATP